MMSENSKLVRIFMTAWFSKAARKALINEDELCRAAAQVLAGQADDLGGGVFKKRLNRNEHRSIIMTSWGDFWIYEYLFAKKDMENIDAAELRAFRMLATSYAGLTEVQVRQLLSTKAWFEICKEVQHA
jgi:hypothetical protein